MRTQHLSPEDAALLEECYNTGQSIDIGCIETAGGGIAPAPPVWQRQILSFCGMNIVETAIAVKELAAQDASEIVPWTRFAQDEINKMGFRVDPGEWTRVILQNDQLRKMRIFVMGGAGNEEPLDWVETELCWFAPIIQLTHYRIACESCPDRGREIGGVAAGREWVASGWKPAEAGALPEAVKPKPAVKAVKSKGKYIE